MMAYCSTVVNEDNIFYSFHFCFLLVFSFNSSLFFSWKNLSQSSSPLSLSLSLSHRSPFALSFSPMPLPMTLSLPMPLTSHCPSTHFLITLPSRCGCGFVKFSRWDWHGQGSGSCYGDEIDVVVGLQIGFGHGWWGFANQF